MAANRVQSKGDNSGGTSVTTIEATFDSAPTEGNVLVCGASYRSNAGTVTGPSGWTEIHNSANGWIGYKVVAASEPATVTVTNTTARRAAIVIAEYSGVDAADVLNVASTVQTGTTVTSLSSGTTAATDEADTQAVAVFLGDYEGEFVTPTYSNSFSQYIKENDFGARPVAYIADNGPISISTAVETTITATSGAGQSMAGVVLVFNKGPLVAGTASSVDRTDTTASVSATDATGGSGSYTYQWHRDTSSGFTPGVGNAVSGATSLTLNDSGLTDATAYYYVLVYDDGTDTASSNELSITTSADPLVVITDHDDATSGTYEIMGPGIAMFTIAGSLKGGGEWNDVKVEWDFGRPGADYNTHRGFCGGHLYDVEPVSNTDYTVTCTITNSLGNSASATRTVRVTPNTRRVVYVDPDTGSASPTDPTDSGDPYDTITNCVAGETLTDLEIQFTAGKTHTWGATVGGSTSNNIILRSTTKGSQFTIQATSSGNPILAGGVGSALRDAAFTASGLGAQVKMLDPRSATGHNCWLLNCTGNDPAVATCFGGATTKSTLLQDVTNNGHNIGGDVLFGSHRWVMHNVQILGYEGTERPFRGTGDYVTMNQCVAKYDATNGKTACSRTGGQWFYADKCEFSLESGATGGSGTPLQIGHTSGTYSAGPQYSIVERCRISINVVTPASEQGMTIGGTAHNVDYCTVRNCIIEGSGGVVIGSFDGSYPTTNVHVFNTTVKRTGSFGAVTVFQYWSDVTIAGLLATSDQSSGLQALSVDELSDDVANQGLSVTDSVWPVEDGNEDARVDGAADRLTWAEFNALSVGSGNLSKSISLNATTFRPDDTDDSDILFAAPTEMGAVPEDYYGNPRTGSWVAGAVDAVPADAAGGIIRTVDLPAGGEVAGSCSYPVDAHVLPLSDM
jgi:hypothetical protein